MDMGDFLLGGIVIGGGYIAYRAYRDHQAADAAPGTATGAAAASMLASAANSTTFSNQSLLRRLLPARILPPKLKLLSAQAPPMQAARAQARAAAPINAQVARAHAQPTPTAPAFGSRLLVPTSGLAGALPTRPAGDAPQPGDPSPVVFLRGLRP